MARYFILFYKKIQDSIIGVGVHLKNNKMVSEISKIAPSM